MKRLSRVGIGYMTLSRMTRPSFVSVTDWRRTDNDGRTRAVHPTGYCKATNLIRRNNKSRSDHATLLHRKKHSSMQAAQSCKGNKRPHCTKRSDVHVFSGDGYRLSEHLVASLSFSPL